MNDFLKAASMATILLVSAIAQTAASSLTVKEAPLLSEKEFTDAIRRGHCIILFYNSALHDKKKEEMMRGAFGVTPQQLTDQLMRGMIGFKEKIASSVKFYKVNWKDYSAGSIEKIRSDTVSPTRFPENPSIVTYGIDGSSVYRMKGLARPDSLPWFMHEIMGYYIHSVKLDKGEFLRAGWMITDTTSAFINLVSERKDTIEFNGRIELVQIINYVSRRYDGVACEYERIYSRDGRLLGSIETYGKKGTFGYFDYDRTGIFQYRVTYRSRAEKP